MLETLSGSLFSETLPNSPFPPQPDPSPWLANEHCKALSYFYLVGSSMVSLICYVTR